MLLPSGNLGGILNVKEPERVELNDTGFNRQSSDSTASHVERKFTSTIASGQRPPSHQMPPARPRRIDEGAGDQASSHQATGIAKRSDH
jgi:hypothetical protein